MVQLGLLGLQVVPEGLLQCRTQQWNSSASNNRDRQRGEKTGREGGREEKEGKREGRKRGEREGREEEVWGRKRGRRRVWGGTNHVTSLLLTSPRAATKGGMLSYLLYSVGRPASSLRGERKTEGSTSAIPSLLIPTNTHKH